MKKLYQSPELEISMLTSEDVLTDSPIVDEPENEIFMDGNLFFGS